MEGRDGGEQEGVFERGEEAEGEGRGVLEERGGADSENAGKRVGEQDEEGSVPDSDECAEGVRGDDGREGGGRVVRDGLFVGYAREKGRLNEWNRRKKGWKRECGVNGVWDRIWHWKSDLSRNGLKKAKSC